MSEQGKHTPGPWDCWDMDEYGWHVFATKFGERSKGQDCRISIAAVRPGRSHHETSDNFYEQLANARLIAAAPTMYEYIQSSASAGCATAKKILEDINADS